MKILFIGWNENGERCLTNLLGRGHKFEHLIVPLGYDIEPMKDIAAAAGIPVYEYDRNLEQLEELVRKINPDLIIVASFPKLLPQKVLDLPRLGVINVHTGELPKYRGFHPLNWAIIRDEPRIGVTVHYMDAGMDTGDVLAQATVEMTNRDTILTIKDKTTALGAELLGPVVDKIANSGGKIPGTPQRDSQVLFAPRRTPGDSKIKWGNTSRDIFNLVRAVLGPYPNAHSTNAKGEKVEFQSSYVPGTPGSVIGEIEGHYVITTGDGVIMLKTDRKLKIGERLS